MLGLLLIMGIISYLCVVLLWNNVFLTPIVGMSLIYVNSFLVISIKWNRTKINLLKALVALKALPISLKDPYKLIIIFIFLFCFILRVNNIDTTRELVTGSDEYIYHFAAESILKNGVLTYDRDGSMFNGVQPLHPTTALSPGYPFYVAIIYALFDHSIQAVLISQFIMSMVCFWLIYKFLMMFQVRRLIALIVLLLAAVYPGFLYDTDRMLTEQLFMTLFIGFVYVFLRGIQSKRFFLIGLSAVLVTLATHVRALAFPFIAVVIFFLLVYERENKKRMVYNLGIFLGVVFLCMLPWWIRNAVTFHTFMLFSEAGESPKIWGAVPYFLDMGSTANKNLSMVLQDNITPNPLVFYKWRLFGFFQYMWSDIWDENLTHPIKWLRPFLVMQQLVIVPCIIAIPFLIRKCRKEVIFVSCIPIIYTLLNMPFHGLPRYVFPSLPFVFILLGVILDKVRKKKPESSDPFLYKWQRFADIWLRRAYLVFTILFSLNLFYSVYIFAYGINGEMSQFRLSKYMGVDIKSLKAEDQIESKTFDLTSMTVENVKQLDANTFKNNVDAPDLVRLNDTLTGSEKAVTEVDINIHGGYPFDLMTVYWTGKNTPEISENKVYKFPINPLEKTHKIYIDDDVTSLMIVPNVFRWGTFTVNSIDIHKYQVK